MATKLRNITLFSGYSYGSRRQIPYFETLSELYAYCKKNKGRPFDTYRTYENINFVPGDEVNSSQIINDPIEDPTYLITTAIDEPDKIMSRWWVISSTRTTGMNAHQVVLTLRRDVIGENINWAKKAPAYIDKGWINEIKSPYLWNRENVKVDQVKKAEYMIPDESKCRWIVGYMTKGDVKNLPSSNTIDIAGDGTQSPITDAVSYPSREAFARALGLTSLDGNICSIDGMSLGWRILVNSGALNNTVTIVKKPNGTYSENPIDKSFGNKYNYYSLNYKDYVMAVLNNYEFSTSNYNHLAQLVLQANNIPLGSQIMKDGMLGMLRNINAVYFEDEKKNYQLTTDRTIISYGPIYPTNDPELTAYINNNYNQAAYSSNLVVHDGGPTYFAINGELSSVKITLTELSTDRRRIIFPASESSRIHIDEPFDMFLIPYSDKVSTFIPGGTLARKNYIMCSKRYAMIAANALIKALGIGSSSNLYDIQILPYLPDSSLLSFIEGITPGTFSYDVGTNDAKRLFYMERTNDSGQTWIKEYPIYMAASNKRSMTIPVGGYGRTVGNIHFYTVGINETDAESLSYKPSNLEAKLANETQLWRLNSPNFQGAFEFSPQMNHGVTGFHIDVDYKPFNPYIHVAPKFGGMYGSDFGDARGLICGGDFSLPALTDQWTNYQLNNKNYEAIFNRQIQNMEITQDVQRKEQIFSIISQAIGTGGRGAGYLGAAGATIGGAAGGAVGAAIGAGLNVGVSVVGGVLDWQNSERLRAEQLDYAKDVHRLNLQNIQALPYSLSKTGAQYITNREFPFLELYEAPSNEITALREKITYDGMTIGADMTIQDAISPDLDYTFIRGILEDMPKDTKCLGPANLYNALQSELQLGAYIPKKEA